MSEMTVAPAAGRTRGTARQRSTRWLGRNFLYLYTAAAIVYLMLPIVVMIVFSFNDPVGKSNFTWVQFSLDAWLRPFGALGLQSAVFASLRIAFISTVVATILGTLIGLALTRYTFRGRAATNLFIFLPMATPEIVLGASLLTMFVSIGQPRNELTILIAHIMFNISFVVVTVRARLAGFPRHLEEAAMDLGATEWVTFWKVTFPLIFPGVMAAALLAFSLSIDDFVITNFTAGQTVTFPMYIYGSYRVGVPVQVNVIGTIIFLTAVGAVLLSTVLQRRDRSA
jgi:spermidine/putrescine transport system permease protein